MFVVAVCRFQHDTLPLAAVHYLTWSLLHVGLYALAFLGAGTVGAFALAIALACWAMRLDLRIGLLFALWTASCAAAASAIVPVLAWTTSATAVASVVSIAVAFVLELASHLVLQGHHPRVPRDAPRSPAYAVTFFFYFVVLFGFFFLTLDLAMRHAHMRVSLHRRVSDIVGTWHDATVR